MKYNFKGFTEKANIALNLAIEAAEEMGHTYIGSEHLLLGLCKENSGVAYAALSDRAIWEEDLRDIPGLEDLITEQLRDLQLLGLLNALAKAWKPHE